MDDVPACKKRWTSSVHSPRVWRGVRKKQAASPPAHSLTHFPPCPRGRRLHRTPFTHLITQEDKEKDITLYINSPGGSVSAGMAIYDAMQFVPCDVATVCFGMAASMGAFLLGAGARV